MTKNQKIQTGFSVKSSSYSEESGDHSDDEFSRGDTHTSHSVEGVVLAFDYPDCAGPFLALSRDEMYIVSVIYSTGDSFGYDHGRGLEHVAVFKTLEKANRYARQIEAYAALENSYNSFDKKSLHKHIKEISLPPHELGKLKDKNEGWVLKDISAGLVFLNENDEPIETSTPWYGYFENLDYVNVSAHTVEMDVLPSLDRHVSSARPAPRKNIKPK